MSYFIVTASLSANHCDACRTTIIPRLIFLCTYTLRAQSKSHLTVNRLAAATTSPLNDFSTSTGGVSVHPETFFSQIIAAYLTANVKVCSQKTLYLFPLCGDQTCWAGSSVSNIVTLIATVILTSGFRDFSKASGKFMKSCNSDLNFRGHADFGLKIFIESPDRHPL